MSFLRVNCFLLVTIDQQHFLHSELLASGRSFMARYWYIAWPATSRSTELVRAILLHGLVYPENSLDPLVMQDLDVPQVAIISDFCFAPRVISFVVLLCVVISQYSGTMSAGLRYRHFVKFPVTNAKSIPYATGWPPPDYGLESMDASPPEQRVWLPYGNLLIVSGSLSVTVIVMIRAYTLHLSSFFCLSVPPIILYMAAKLKSNALGTTVFCIQTTVHNIFSGPLVVHKGPCFRWAAAAFGISLVDLTAILAYRQVSPSIKRVRLWSLLSLFCTENPRMYIVLEPGPFISTVFSHSMDFLLMIYWHLRQSMRFMADNQIAQVLWTRSVIVASQPMPSLVLHSHSVEPPIASSITKGVMQQTDQTSSVAISAALIMRSDSSVSFRSTVGTSELHSSVATVPSIGSTSIARFSAASQVLFDLVYILLLGTNRVLRHKFQIGENNFITMMDSFKHLLGGFMPLYCVCKLPLHHGVYWAVLIQGSDLVFCSISYGTRCAVMNFGEHSIVPWRSDPANCWCAVLARTTFLIPSILYLYGSLFLPLRKYVYADNKAKKVPMVNHIFRNSLKLKTSDAETVIKLHDAAEKFQSLIPSITSNELEHLEEVHLRNNLDVSDTLRHRIVTGKLLREIKIFWRVSLLISILIPLNDLGHSDAAEIIKGKLLYERVEVTVKELGLDKVWEMKPLINGKEIMRILQLNTGGPQVRIWQERLLEWQLGHPTGTAEECLAWMRQELEGQTHSEDKLEEFSTVAD